MSFPQFKDVDKMWKKSFDIIFVGKMNKIPLINMSVILKNIDKTEMILSFLHFSQPEINIPV